jgi:hypothetical protein
MLLEENRCEKLIFLSVLKKCECRLDQREFACSSKATVCLRVVGNSGGGGGGW